ncbi:MAG: hypothetical protein JWP11_2727, partial [Frankiales bacterium]|nr:hypothetical protein [Frankiales bacterium]
MTLPAPTFTTVAPPADGLSLAFGAARRRRNSKAGVTAFGGAVAIASVLSLLAPPGQTLVQQPLPPARDGLVPGLQQAPQQLTPKTPVLVPASAGHVLPAGA